MGLFCSGIFSQIVGFEHFVGTFFTRLHIFLKRQRLGLILANKIFAYRLHKNVEFVKIFY